VGPDNSSLDFAQILEAQEIKNLAKKVLLQDLPNQNQAEFRRRNSVSNHPLRL
jgi:hypothetical protein